VWAVHRIAGAGATALLMPVREKESDATVLAEYSG
jgi:hypothetical protein